MVQALLDRQIIEVFERRNILYDYLNIVFWIKGDLQICERWHKLADDVGDLLNRGERIIRNIQTQQIR